MTLPAKVAMGQMVLVIELALVLGWMWQPFGLLLPAACSNASLNDSEAENNNTFRI